jgi:hypothetical protein
MGVDGLSGGVCHHRSSGTMLGAGELSHKRTFVADVMFQHQALSKFGQDLFLRNFCIRWKQIYKRNSH